MPFPTEGRETGAKRPYRKLSLDVDGVETAFSPPPVFERQQTRSGAQRLLITVPADKPDVFRVLAARMSPPLFVLYILHTPRGEGAKGRYQSPPLDSRQIEDFLADVGPFLAGDARHDTWVYSPSDGRTLVWDRHDLIYAEGEPTAEIEAALEKMGFTKGSVPRIGDHIHYYRQEFDDDAAAVLARFDWDWSELRPGDEQ